MKSVMYKFKIYILSVRGWEFEFEIRESFS